MSIIKLINKYFVRSVVGFVCLFGTPLFFGLLFFAVGKNEFITSFPIISSVGILSPTLMIIPTMIIEFKKSLILKRIGAAKISKNYFLILLFLYFYVVVIVAIIYAFILYAILSSIRYGLKDSWEKHNIFDAIYSCFVLWTISIIVSIIIGLNTKNSMIASAISFCIIFFSLFTSGLLMPISEVRQIKGLVWIGYIIPFDWPIITLQESWGIGSFIPNNGQPYYWIDSDNIWNIKEAFYIYVSKIGQKDPVQIKLISKLAKSWNIFAPYVFIAVLSPILPLTFKWTER